MLWECVNEAAWIVRAGWTSKCVSRGLSRYRTFYKTFDTQARAGAPTEDRRRALFYFSEHSSNIVLYIRIHRRREPIGLPDTSIHAYATAACEHHLRHRHGESLELEPALDIHGVLTNPFDISPGQSIDVDDVGALCVAHALQEKQEAKILAVVHNSQSAFGVAAISAINAYHGRDDIPVGVYSGRVGSSRGTSPQSPWGFTRRAWQVGPYVEDLALRFPSRVRNASTADGDAVAVMKRALAAASDRSVTIVSVGYATNLYDLLRTAEGRYLAEQKVAKLVMMGGRTGHIEWNFAGAEANGISVCEGADRGCRDDPSYEEVVEGGVLRCADWVGFPCSRGDPSVGLVQPERIARLMAACPQSCTDGRPACIPKGGCGPRYNNLGRITNATLALWPSSIPLVFVPFETGSNVNTGSILRSAAPESSPCRRAYEVFCRANEYWCSDAGNRQSWDIVAVVYAVRGTEGVYTLARGHNTVDAATALNTWTADGATFRSDEEAISAAAAAADTRARLVRPEYALLIPPSQEPHAHMAVEDEISDLMASTYFPKPPTPPPNVPSPPAEPLPPTEPPPPLVPPPPHPHHPPSPSSSPPPLPPLPKSPASSSPPPLRPPWTSAPPFDGPSDLDLSSGAEAPSLPADDAAQQHTDLLGYASIGSLPLLLLLAAAAQCLAKSLRRGPRSAQGIGSMEMHQPVVAAAAQSSLESAHWELNAAALQAATETLKTRREVEGVDMD